MELNRESFEEFVERLRYHNDGEGVAEHCTAHPIFNVQQRVRITGIDTDYGPSFFWTTEDGEGEYNHDEIEEEIKATLDEDEHPDPYDLQYDEQITCNSGETVLFRRIGYVERWEHVSSHFTKEAAEAFIKRKKHDYRELRVYVDSQYYCWEYNAVIKGLVTGQIVFQENATQGQPQ